jgi:hypothetical protein
MPAITNRRGQVKRQRQDNPDGTLATCGHDAGVNVGQRVSPAPFPGHSNQGGAGETHCPTLRFIGRGSNAIADEGWSDFPAWW